MIVTTNPANPAETVGEYAPTDLTMLDGLFDTARDAQREWSRVPAPARAAALGAFLDALEKRREEIVRITVREQGKTRVEANGELTKGLGEARAVCARALHAIGEVMPAGRVAFTTYTTRRARGVIVGICPWNFPISTPLRKLVPALIYGNAMVLKPSELTPGAAELITECAHDHLPNGLLTTVYGGRELGKALTARTDLDAVSFTGSVGAGRQVAAVAAASLAEISLELGGKNPAIIHDADDLDAALDQVFAAAMAVSGQRCTAIGRVLVHGRLAEKVAAGLAQRAQSVVLGDGLEQGVTMGPLINETQRERVQRFVRTAEAEGARIRAGGRAAELPGGGYFFQPTILDRVDPAQEIAREEIFGPVLPVIGYESLEEALTIANSVVYGLTSCLFSQDLAVVDRFLAESRSGMLHVNSGSFPDDHMPFVGSRASALGVGGSNGPSLLHFYTSEHAVYLKARA